jgi:hypothetical protein
MKKYDERLNTEDYDILGLTADAGGIVESIEDVLVNFNELVSFTGSFEISGNDLVFDPILKSFSS